MDYLQRCYAEIDLDNLARNYADIRVRLSGKCKLMGVVKADAYGHGDRRIAKELETLGLDWLAVSNIEEALSIRAAGVQLPMLVLGHTPIEYAEALHQHNITQTIFSSEYGAQLCEAASAKGLTINAHIKIDTGMNRIGLGYSGDDVEDIIQLYHQKHVHCTGIFTHFAVADELAPRSVEFTAKQYQRFDALCDHLQDTGLNIGLRHCCNSAGTILYPQYHMDMVRVGISLYGLLPSGDLADKIQPHPVMSLYAAVTMVKTIGKDEAVSYGCTYIAAKPCKIATVAVGYADGFSREYSNRGKVLLRGGYAPVIGRVCMDQIVVDITHIPNVQAGDIAILAGSDGTQQITMDQLATICKTINYEKVCLVGKRVTRLYKKGGAIVAQTKYFN